MISKSVQLLTKGMQKDLSRSKFNPEFAYDMMNIRLTARDHNTLLSATNERGTLQLSLKDSSNNDISILGTYIGHCVLNDYLVIFTTDNGTDRIYRLEKFGESTTLIGLKLYEGNLSFNTLKPISAIGIYENEDIQKVYWLDGINQTRMMNIVASDTIRASWNNNSFEFVQTLALKETITVTRNSTGNGSFAPGVIQYAFSYYNKYGQQSNIFYVTPLQYISYNDRGGAADSTVSNSFNIDITGMDTNFDYLRVYSIHRTSLDATPTVLSVVDLPVTSSEVVYTDTGVNGDSVTASDLLYIGGEDVVFQTMSHKDNTLFLGNALLKRYLIDTSVSTHLNGGTITFLNKTLSGYNVTQNGYYPYQNTLSYGEAIKGLKYLEYYRFGVQFQHKTGKWSEPIFINDAQVTLPPSCDNGTLSLTEAQYVLSNTNGDITNLIGNDYIKARPVIVFPTINDRNIIAQGILCPTVYNVGDRTLNAPFAQSSWFLRPNMQYDIATDGSQSVSGRDLIDQPFAVIANGSSYATIFNTIQVDLTNKGYWAQFIHNKPIPDNYERNAEIQCLAYGPTSPYTSYTGSDLKLWEMNYQEFYYIDQNIVTMHSPELEFDTNVQNLDMSNVKLRIVGYANMTANIGDQNVETSTVGNDATKIGFYKETIGTQNLSPHGLKSWMGHGAWIDVAYKVPATDNTLVNDAFFIYPWHRNGSLNNQGNDTSRTAMLKVNQLSNLKFSSNTVYLNSSNIWNAYISGSSTNTGITKATLFNSDDISVIKIPAPTNSSLSSLNYYGNVDKVVHASRFTDGNVENEGNYTINKYLGSTFWGVPTSTPISMKKVLGYPICTTSVLKRALPIHQLYGGDPAPLIADSGANVPTAYTYGTDAVSMKYKSTPHAVFALNYTTGGLQRILPTNIGLSGNSNNVPDSLYAGQHPFWNESVTTAPTSGVYSPTMVASGGTQPSPTGLNQFMMVYTQSTKDSRNNYLTYFGTLYISTTDTSSSTGFSWTTAVIAYPASYFLINSLYYTATFSVVSGSTYCTFNIYKVSTVSQDSLNIQPSYGYLWVGELYRDTITNRFGGQTTEAFMNNQWIPAGEPVSLADSNGNTKSSIILTYDKGDTYLQRYDCMKTYPYADGDQNSITEIGSFMCETHINLDGRYDRNRGLTSNIAVTPTNFNLLNTAYNQTNNFYNYNGIDHERLDNNYFPSTLTWSSEKVLGAVVDAWTNVTMASTLDLDGDKGSLTSLNMLNNEIYAFQKRGFSNILFNSRVQIPTSDGVPIQITNGEKVSGKVYISNTVGCNNKWSIKETPSGIYFIDNITNSIYLFTGQNLNSLSDKLGLRAWISDQNTTEDWDPVNMYNFRTFYDRNNNDVYFVNKDYCLGYSELLGQFTSFYSYNNVPAMFSIDDGFFSIKGNSVWENFKGNYNYFYGTFQPYSITYIVNPYENMDKIFNTIDFRADSWNTDDTLNASCPFTGIKAWDEYQSGELPLALTIGSVNPLQKKFRIWRANIPRNGDTLAGTRGLDRIRNPWIFLKLSNTTDNQLRTELHDVNVNFSV